MAARCGGLAGRRRRRLQLAIARGEVLDGLHALWRGCSGDGGRRWGGPRGLVVGEVSVLRVFGAAGFEVVHENVSGVY